MKYLLDTHTSLWLLDGDPRLGPKTRRLLQQTPAANIYYSAASLWEIHIKVSIGKLDVSADFEDALVQKGFESLPVMSSHTRPIASLPLRHRDPFDRMLIAQAMSENLTLITSDENIIKYPEITCHNALL